MGVDVEAISAISCGTNRRVIASADRPSAESWRISVLVSTFIRESAAGVGGIVVLRACVTGVSSIESAEGRRKCLRIGHVTEVVSRVTSSSLCRTLTCAVSSAAS